MINIGFQCFFELIFNKRSGKAWTSYNLTTHIVGEAEKQNSKNWNSKNRVRIGTLTHVNIYKYVHTLFFSYRVTHFFTSVSLLTF